MSKIKTTTFGKKIAALFACMLIACLGASAAFADVETNDGSVLLDSSQTGSSQVDDNQYAPGTSVEGLELSKTATANDDGSYTITLETYTTGEQSAVTIDKPSDIVLVLDWSGSMSSPFNPEDESYYKYSKMAALETAAKEFIKTVAASEGDHRVGVVVFGDRDKTEVRHELAPAVSNEDSLLEAVSYYWMCYRGETYIDEGLKLANGMLYPKTSSANEADRDKVIVVFTDGCPGASTGSNWSTTNGDTVANDAIKEAFTMKDLGASVYTVAVVDGADPSDVESKINKFLNYVSSNYPDAESMDVGGTGSNAGFYATASNAEDLKKAFDKIAGEVTAVTPTVTMGSSVVIKDVLTRYFVMPTNVSDIHVSTAECTKYVAEANGAPAVAEWASPEPLTNASVGLEGRAVSVSGFSFDDNFVREGDRSTDASAFLGKKLVISFTVNPEEEFWGGNDVPTNEYATIHAMDANNNPVLVGTFEQPTVNVPLKTGSIATSRDIYLLGEIPDLSTLVVPSGDDSWKIDYVKVDNVVDGSGTISNIKDAVVNMTIGVSAKTDGKNSAGSPSTGTVERSATTTVNVFKPVVTFQDSIVWAGTTLENYDENHAGVEWRHGNDSANTDTMGDAPELTYSYNPAAGTINADTPVKVSVEMADVNSEKKDVTEYVTFVRKKCEKAEGCNSEDAVIDSADDKRVNFIVHAKHPTLSVVKSVELVSAGMDESQIAEAEKAILSTYEGQSSEVSVEFALYEVVGTGESDNLDAPVAHAALFVDGSGDGTAMGNGSAVFKDEQGNVFVPTVGKTYTVKETSAHNVPGFEWVAESNDNTFTVGQEDVVVDFTNKYTPISLTVDITKNIVIDDVDMDNWSKMSQGERDEIMPNAVEATFGLYAENETEPLATQTITVPAGDNDLSEKGTLAVFAHSLELGKRYVVKEISASPIQDYSLYETTYTYGGTNGEDVLLVAPVQEQSIVCTNKYEPTISVLPTLTIVKHLPEKPDSGESFMFRVVGTNNDETVVSSNVILNSSQFVPTSDGYMASIQISALPEGNYTVTEVTDWSWRYELAQNGVVVYGVDSSEITNEGGAFDLDKESEAEIAFSNVAGSNNWLTFTDWCENLFKSSGIEKVTPAAAN